MPPTLSTPALVLHTTEYSESSVIAKVFTRQLGVRSYILKGVRKGGSRTKRNLLQPLSYLDMVVYANPKTTLNYVKELAPHPLNSQPKVGDRQWSQLSTDRQWSQLSTEGRRPPVEPTLNSQLTLNSQHSTLNSQLGNAVIFFMTELLYKTLREEEPDQDLFDYIVSSLEQLRQPLPAMHAQMPLLFLLRLTRYLGLWPRDNYSLREPLFDMQEGCFRAVGETTIGRDSSRLLHEYLMSLEQGTACPAASLAQRTELMNRLIEYLQLHLEGFKDFHSHEILHTILN